MWDIKIIPDFTISVMFDNVQMDVKFQTSLVRKGYFDY